ncbi:LacI family DNA-binding transcriptional regulator, partial [Escherichia coli]|uniref:LacI family DNA-binding transcriptional regulator n=1 Tax=Escherichia coli TaxID=562 RepID=UPI0032E3A5F6
MEREEAPDQAVTLADVAAAAGVSLATASKALADRYDVAQKTKERVHRAAEELSFSPNVLARGLLGGKTQSVGIITSDLDGRFAPSIMKGAEDALGADSSNVIMCNSRGNPELELHHAKALLGRRVDGLLIVGDEPEPRAMLQLRTRVPVVYVYQPCEDPL